MRTTPIIALVVMSTAVPAVAHAAASCVDVYEKCLNDSWDTSGLARYLANLECAAKYAGCVRKQII